VTLTSAATGSVNCLEGGEEVELEIEAELNKDLQHPIIGFHVLNKLGQMVFGDNTYLVYRTSKVSMAAGSRLSGRFRFQMPYLPTGDYAVSVAIATGTQEDYVPQHWVDDALFFRVNSSHVSRGLCGIPMMDVTLVKDGARVPAQSPLSPL
jgi:lipopolysaccharide transport system ATP-binding protein